MKDIMTLASLSPIPCGVMKKSVKKYPSAGMQSQTKWIRASGMDIFISLKLFLPWSQEERHQWHPGEKDKHTCQGLFPFQPLTVLDSIGRMMFSYGGTTCYFDILITISHWLISLSKHVNFISPESERVCSFCLWACLWHQRMSLEEHRDPSGIPERSHVGHKQM